MWWPSDTSLVYREHALDFYRPPAKLWECLETRMTGPEGYWSLYSADRYPCSVEFELLKRMHGERLQKGYGYSIDTRGLHMLGIRALWKGELALALKSFKHAVAADRHIGDSEVGRLLCLLLDLRRFGEARLVLEKTWRLRVPYLRREIQLGSPDGNDSVNKYLYRRIAETTGVTVSSSFAPKHPESWSEVGAKLYERGYCDLAEASLREALRLSPNRSDDRMLLANLYHLRGSENAVTQVHLVLDQFPEHEDALRLGAQFLLERNAHDLAAPFLEKIVELQPGPKAEARFITARAMVVLGKRKEAQSAVEALVDDFPYEVRFLKYLADLYRLAGDKACLDCYLRLSAMEPRDRRHSKMVEEALRQWPLSDATGMHL